MLVRDVAGFVTRRCNEAADLVENGLSLVWWDDDDPVAQAFAAEFEEEVEEIFEELWACGVRGEVVAAPSMVVDLDLDLPF